MWHTLARVSLGCSPGPVAGESITCFFRTPAVPEPCPSLGTLQLVLSHPALRCLRMTLALARRALRAAPCAPSLPLPLATVVPPTG